jgi:hypothetical protein
VAQAGAASGANECLLAEVLLLIGYYCVGVRCCFRVHVLLVASTLCVFTGRIHGTKNR